MTNKQREQTIELLRCAADELICGRYADDGFNLFDSRSAVCTYATSAWVNEVCLNDYADEKTTHEDAATRMLSAAARIEEKSWP